MASSNNALWIGAIVIVAALTAVELMSTRDDAETAESTSDTVAGTTAPASPQFDAGQIATGESETIDSTDITNDENESAHADIDESGFQFDTESEFASDLIVDLDDPQSNQVAVTENLQGELETDTSEAVADLTAALSADEALTTETDPAGTEPVETLVDSVEAIITEEDAPAYSNISQHLAAAEEALTALRMTTPAGDNAYEHYQAVLAIDPGNADAHAGIRKMVDMYIYFAEKAMTEGQSGTARVYLQRAEKLSPDSPRLKSLRAELD